MEEKAITINTDGGARGNPGPAAWAFVVKSDGNILHTDSGYLGVSTNNQAEYTGVLKAMIWLGENKEGTQSTEINFILDSEHVARQLSGIYKIKDSKLSILATEIKKLERKIDFKFSYTSVRREFNKEADALVNAVLDSR
jgi:ribonuclease HI